MTISDHHRAIKAIKNKIKTATCIEADHCGGTKWEVYFIDSYRQCPRIFEVRVYEKSTKVVREL